MNANRALERGYPHGSHWLHEPTMSAAPSAEFMLPGDTGFVTEEFPFYWLARFHALYESEVEKVLKKLHTDLPGRRVLLLLRMHGTMSVSELATHAVFKLSTMTRVVQRMRVEGLVHTHTNKEDARVTDVSITPTGTELAARIDLATRKIFVACYAGLSPTQLERFSQTLRAMFRNLSEA